MPQPLSKSLGLETRGGKVTLKGVRKEWKGQGKRRRGKRKDGKERGGEGREEEGMIHVLHVTILYITNSLMDLQ